MQAIEQEKSRFHLYRQKYQPRVPQILNEIKLDSTTHDAAILPEIAEIFPNLVKKGIKSVQFSKGAQSDSIINPLRIGCVLSGGQAAGGHNVIVGIYEYIKKKHKNSQLFGFLNGPKGIFTGNYIELTDTHIKYFKNRGGFDMICSGRDKIQKPDQFEKSLQHCESLKLDGLVVIGGDDSNTNASLLAEYFLKMGSSIRVVGCPKTIDGDLKNQFVQVSFGFDTACKTYSECIGSIMADTLSSKKYYHFIRLMGRSASHIALECALLTKPTYTFIGEEVQQKNQTLKELVAKLIEIIIARSKEKKDYGVILIPEGLIEFIPQMNTLIKEINGILAKNEVSKEAAISEIKEIVLKNLTEESKTIFQFIPEEIGNQLLLDRDPHGNVQVAKIQTQKFIINLVQRQLALKQGFKGKFKPLSNYFGYEGRCAFPTNFDCDYCYSLGLNAAAIIEAGETGLMSCVRNLQNEPQNWLAGGFPLVTMMNLQIRGGKNKPVIKKALVELEGRLFKLYEKKRDKWALGDYFNLQGPVQYEFPNPRPYLAVPPNELQIDKNEEIIGCKTSFAPIHNYNLNPLTESLGKQKNEIPSVLTNQKELRLIQSRSLKYDSKELKIGIQKEYPFIVEKGSQKNRMLTFGKAKDNEMEEISDKKLRIGVSFNGRQFPGAHNIIQGLMNENTEVIGFLNGTKGLFKQQYITISQENMQFFNNLNGLHLLGRSQDKLRGEEEHQITKKCCQDLNLDGLVLVGASHTLTDATSLTDFMIEHNCKTRVVGVPASIDNNIGHPNLQACVGFSTSSHMYSTLISNLMIDASSNTKYWYFIRLMGRDPSHLALQCSLSTRPNYTIISEEVRNKGWDLQQLVDDIVRVIVRRQEKGLGFGCIIIPEGLLHFIPSLRRIKTELDEIKTSDEEVLKKKMSEWAYEKYRKLPQFIKIQLSLRDDSGSLAFSQIQTEKLLSTLVAAKLKQLEKQKLYSGSFNSVCHFFGYQGRCAIPSRLDQNLATTYGTIARILVQKNITGYCPSVRGLQKSPSQWFPIAIPFIHMLSLKEMSQFGVNKPIVRSANVSLKSASFNHFLSKRDLWELNDHYESPGPIQFYGEMNNYLPITLSLEQKYDFEMIEDIYKHLNELKSRCKFGQENQKLKIIQSSLQNLISTLHIIEDE